MPCYPVRLDNGTGAVAIVCGRLGKRCSSCGGISEFLCDFPVGDGKTCDRPMCRDHAVVVGKNRHLCLQHEHAMHVAPFVLE
jgi:hypothetical protein